VFETSLGDLNNNEDSFRKFKLIVEEVQGKTCLTNFHGMDLTTDKVRSMIKKKQVIALYIRSKQLILIDYVLL
jgi:small subunit ribosomal protein S3Ae